MLSRESTVTCTRLERFGSIAFVLLILLASQLPAHSVTDVDLGLSRGEQRFPMFIGMADSVSINAPVVLHGQLMDHDARPLSGAEVLLSAQPSLETKRAMTDGSSYTLVAVARTRTDSEGNYELRSDLSPILRMRHGDDGLDLELDVFTDERHLTWFTQARYDEDSEAWVVPTIPGSEGAEARRGRHVFNRHDVAMETDQGGHIADAVWPEGPSPRHHQGPYITGCTPWYLVGTHTPLETVATAIAANGVTIKALYTSSASTTSGMGYTIGYNGSWLGASWSQNGTRSRTSGWTAGFADRYASSGTTINREYRLNWEHKRWERHCSNGVGGYDIHQFTEPTVATGGGGDYSSRYSLFSCNKSPSRFIGRYVGTESATASTYGSAFSITAGPGTFNGTGRSGYNGHTKITFDFNTTNGGYWCGNNNYPTQAGRVRAWR